VTKIPGGFYQNPCTSLRLLEMRLLNAQSPYSRLVGETDDIFDVFDLDGEPL